MLRWQSNNEWYIRTMMLRLKLTDDRNNENEDFWWCLPGFVQVLCRPCFNKNTRQRRGTYHIGVLIWVRNLGLPFTIHIFLSSCIHQVEVTYSFYCSLLLETVHVSVILYCNNCLRRVFAAYILLDIIGRAFHRVSSSLSSRTTFFWFANCTDLRLIACAKLFIFRPARYLWFTSV